MTHTLLLVRHAEAEGWAPSDRERELTPAGVEAAAALGRWLAEQGFVPDQALVSGAVRTRQTWAAVSEAAGWDLPPDVDESLYAAGPDSALALLRGVPEETGTLLVLGHNPTIHFLAQLLSDGAGDPETEMKLVAGYPPATVAVLQLDLPWVRISEAYCRLLDVRLGR